ncbi:hypothetical protein EJ06DRAFT_583499 [Trichodelitschia bisporula]|uniref:Uncharacterized protein n=1 Tax=Trichodelitschia bisporula TaxID=703511 RepID=A0A6G1HSJ7_9PEZI|nr:hypothetical protein EJ06DRAFT_583499 [Trichodelitschia bisporula]
MPLPTRFSMALRALPRTRIPPTVAPFHRNALLAREVELNPRRDEYSKSASDDDVSTKTGQSAFDSNTDPTQEAADADVESGEVKTKPKHDVSPLETSPANREISQPNEKESKTTSSKGESPEQESSRKRTSGKGNSTKSGKGTY